MDCNIKPVTQKIDIVEVKQKDDEVKRSETLNESGLFNKFFNKLGGIFSQANTESQQKSDNYEIMTKEDSVLSTHLQSQ